MRGLIVSMPLWSIIAVLFVFFSGVSLGARWFVRRNRDDEAREAASEQAKGLLTGVAATFAFFVGFAINVTWGAVTAGQVAVEQQAAVVHQTAWELNNIADRPAAAALTDKLRAYAATVVERDGEFLRTGAAGELPSAAALDTFENALFAYVNDPASKEVRWRASALTSGASAISSASAAVEAVANRALPRALAGLLLAVGVLSAIVMGVTTVVYRRPTMVYIWCLIPAMSITVVLALAYPFAVRSGANLAPMKSVMEQLSAR